MHEPAGVVEILVQILRFTPILNLATPPKKNSDLSISCHFKTFLFWLRNPPPQKNSDLRISLHFKTFQLGLRNTPPNPHTPWHIFAYLQNCLKIREIYVETM